MADAGIFDEDSRVQLLDGQIYSMAPIGSRHAACVRRLTHLFVERAGTEATVSIQNPVRLDAASEPEPDLALVRPRADDYAGHHPTPDDVVLLVEVADTSLGFDRDVKLPLYARAGIPEVWIVALEAGAVHVFRQSDADRYAEHTVHTGGERLTVRLLPNAAPIPVDAVFGT
jgi:Uma2 family endonuclease